MPCTEIITKGRNLTLSKVLATGPYGDPNRFISPYDVNQNNITENSTCAALGKDQSQSSIRVIRMSNSYDPEPREPQKQPGGLCWFGPDMAHITCFAPLAAQTLELPKRYQSGDPQVFDPKTDDGPLIS